MRKLSNDKSIYLEFKKDSSYKEINTKDKSDEISSLLKDDKELESLMNEIVPEHISYNEFWTIYFNKKSKVPSMNDDTIIAPKDSDKKDSADNEPIAWGSDEEEEEEDSSVVIVKKEDISSESIEKASQKESAEDSDEDDWE